MSTPDDPFAPPAEGAAAPAYGVGPQAFPTSPGYGVPPGPPPPGYGPPAEPGMPPAYGSWTGPSRVSTQAVVALVLALASYAVLPLIASVAALYVAASARREIAASGGQVGGAGLARVARVLAIINVVLCLLVLVLVISGIALLARS